MSLYKGTLVTMHNYDEDDSFGVYTCKGYMVDARDEFDPMDICIGIVLDVAPNGIRVRWVQMCTSHMEDHSVLGWYATDNIIEQGQLA